MRKSISKNKNGIVLMFVSSLLVCLGQLFWKVSVDGNIVLLLLGFILYGIGALVMIYAYKFGSLSVLQPMLSMNYIFSAILASMVLKERVTIFNLLGIVVIISGVTLIGGSDD